MLEFFKNLMNSQTFFERAVRAVLGVVAVIGPAQGWFSTEVAAALMGTSLFVGAGEKNPSTPQE